MQEKFASLRLAVNHNELKLVKDIMTTERTIHGLVVNFDFRTPEWSELTKTASFIRDGKSYLVLLDAVDDCFIPWECLESKGTFTVGVFGVADGVRLTTNVLRFNVAESCMCEGEEPAEPTPEIYEQILALCGESNRIAQSVRDDVDAGKLNGKDGQPGKDGEPGKDGKDGKNGISATHSWSGTSLTITSASGTSTVDLKGERGADGKNGTPGQPGKDGINGKDGIDGVSATHSWNGTTLTISSASGTSSANLKGEQGLKGDQGIQGEPGNDGAPGKDGYSPIKGIDYWTDDDKLEIVQDIRKEGYAKESDLKEVEAIAKGRASGYVFDTVADLDLWLTDEANTSNLKLGDNLYIRAKEVPDYWWDGQAKQQLETQKVDLSEYETKTDATAKQAEAEANAKSYADSLSGNYDPAGSAAAAEANAKAYADSAISAAISAISNGDEVSY